MYSRYPSSRCRSSFGGGNDQSCPVGEKPSGGDPTRAPFTQVGPAAVGRERQIVIETDAHAGRERVLLNLGELAIHQPLQPAVEEDLAPVGAGEFGNGGAGGVAEFLGPVGPDPQVGIERVEVIVERAISGVKAK